MSVAVPRYGSVAQMAAYAGLSPKTIRRLVASRAVRGLKVGRRLVIPFEDLDAHILRVEDHRPEPLEAPTMAGAILSPHRSVDAHGRALPMTDEEIRARNQAAIALLDSWESEGDEDEQRETLAALMAGLDEHRLSDRKLFP